MRVPYLYIFMFDIYHLMIIVTGFACVCPEFSLAEKPDFGSSPMELDGV